MRLVLQNIKTSTYNKIKKNKLKPKLFAKKNIPQSQVSQLSGKNVLLSQVTRIFLTKNCLQCNNMNNSRKKTGKGLNSSQKRKQKYVISTGVAAMKSLT